ncbi:TIGR04283 family arsenosugar biosynthesis glycosyltransferase [Companilactobacillus zhongbaensis]|uniref:TIGR04283 family arsenosugar biosynthesis glycosyltransferase n=1 Tax=Companilactobacillus zhongbaensis TaxID=2486009 RepID=UPI000F7B6D00|nr:TIGR04283 family arsenosugar biosynthesis glycosyltransferase [Companilactobacillus zhongbaensis]
MWLSIIIPIYHDDVAMKIMQKQLLAWNLDDVEVIVVDGQERRRPDYLVSDFKYQHTRANRGMQLQSGSQKALGRKLLFLHADSKFPSGSPLPLLSKTNINVGYFDLHFDAPEKFFRMMEFGTNLRSKYRKLIFGDQGLFIDRRLYEFLGGYPQIAIMEDYELSKILRRKHINVQQLNIPILTSARKYQQQGHWATFLKMQLYQIRYQMGTSVAKLQKEYYRGEK